MLSDHEYILGVPLGMRGCDSIGNVICHAKRCHTDPYTLEQYRHTTAILISILFRLYMLIGSPKCRLQCFEGCTCILYILLVENESVQRRN